MVVNFSGTSLPVETKVKNKQKSVTFQGAKPLQQVKGDSVSFGKDEKEVPKEKPAGDGQKLQVLKSLAKGIIKPIKDIFKALVEAPLATGIVIAATAAVIAALPIVGTALAVGICGLGVVKIGKGTIDAIRDHKQGQNGKANADIEKVGEGIFDVGLTANAAIKGVKQIGNTVQAIKQAGSLVEAPAVMAEAVAPNAEAAVNAVKAQKVNFFQKLYAIVQQVQKADDIPRGPTNINEFITRVKQDGITQLTSLKETLTGKKTSPTSAQVEEALKGTEQLKAKAGEAAEYIQGLADTIKNEGKAKGLLNQAAEWIGKQEFDKVIANKEQIMVALNQANVETVTSNPSIARVVQRVLNATNPDDAVKLIRKAAGAEEVAAEARSILKATVGELGETRTAATVGVTGEVSEENR